MPINKVDFAGQTLIDLTKDTVTAASLLRGITAHDKAGNLITGTAEAGGGGSPGGGGFDPAPFTRIEVKTLTPAQETKNIVTGMVGASLFLIVYNGKRVFMQDQGILGLGVGACGPFVGSEMVEDLYGMSQGIEINEIKSKHFMYYPESGAVLSYRPFGAGKEYIMVAFFGPEV